MNKLIFLIIVATGVFSIPLFSSIGQKSPTSQKKIDVMNKFDGITKASKPKKKDSAIS